MESEPIEVTVEHVYSDDEYIVIVNDIELGSWEPGQGIVLSYSEGSAVSLDELAAVIKKLRKLERQLEGKNV